MMTIFGLLGNSLNVFVYYNKSLLFNTLSRSRIIFSYYSLYYYNVDSKITIIEQTFMCSERRLLIKRILKLSAYYEQN